MQDACDREMLRHCPGAGDLALRDAVVCALVLLVGLLISACCAWNKRKSARWSFTADAYRKNAPGLRSLRERSYFGNAAERLFYGLQWLSPATWRYGTRAASHNDTDLETEEPQRAKFVEIVVICWLALELLALAFSFRSGWWFTSPCVCALASLRICDIFQAQVNGHVWDALRVKPKERVGSVQRSLMLAALNYLELAGWFSAVYANFELVRDAKSIGDYLYFGAITQLTIGYGELAPVCVGRFLAPLQTLLGTLLLVVGVARLVAGMPPPERRGGGSPTGPDAG